MVGDGEVGGSGEGRGSWMLSACVCVCVYMLIECLAGAEGWVVVFERECACMCVCHYGI